MLARKMPIFDTGMNAADQRATILRILSLLLRPIAAFCMRHGISIRDLTEVSKRAFVDAAAEEVGRTTKKINVSRLSVLTGIYREEVRRLYHEREEIDLAPASIPGRVLGQWEQDRRFCTKSGEPRVLTCEGEGSEFYALVQSVTKNINPGTVLFELERNGAAVRTPRGLKFVRSNFAAGEDLLSAYTILAKDLRALMEVVRGNVSGKTKAQNLHLRTSYDNIFVKDIDTVREWLRQAGRRFHKEVRDYLSQYDKDIATNRKADEPAGGQVNITTFALCEKPPAEEE